MKMFALLATLLLALPAEAQTDAFGRLPVCTGSGPVTCTISGVSVTGTSLEAALSTLGGMAPPSYSAPAPSAVPQSAEMWKAKAVMAGKPSKTNAGKTLLDDANGIIATTAMPVQIAWANAADLSRSSQTVALLAAAIGLSAADLDALFTAAAAFTLP